MYLLLEMLDFFGMYTRDKYSSYSLFVVLGFSVVASVLTKLPASRVFYKIPKKDLAFEVCIGDLLESSAPNIVISTNTTFDTDIGNGLINPDSVQGKFTAKFFGGNTEELDEQINASLEGEEFEEISSRKGKTRRYPMGTVAKVSAHGKAFYLVAMSELNADGNASTSIKDIDLALERLWEAIAVKGELGDVATAIIGTGRGRLSIPRKKVVEHIAQSFADEVNKNSFSSKLSIFVFPPDAERFNVNLFEIRDYLVQSLHA
ncbi:macro domain-containing protein [uncultured Parvibaculum sp.]|uniref:macro domain-containing protein n=1 Tax=uncultured Parvibaculum sp. TaxID=291828 RepID=UPI0030DDAE5C